MGLKLAVDNPYDGLENNAYVNISDLNLKKVEHTGILRLSIWNVEQSRRDGKHCIGNINIRIREPEVIDGVAESEVDENGFVQFIAWDNINEKTWKDIYIKIKTFKVNFNNQELDLSSSIDVI